MAAVSLERKEIPWLSFIYLGKFTGIQIFLLSLILFSRQSGTNVLECW